ncbi:MAG: hypothetical protein ACYDGN_14700 [Acidimicrobiales bacterium]
MPGSVNSLVFANRADGYALESDPANPLETKVYATTDGARTWHRVAFASHTSIYRMVSSSKEFYAILVRCSGSTTSETCDESRLGRSKLGSRTWSSVAIPGITTADSVGVSVQGSQVLLNYQADTAGAKSMLLTSRDGKGPFTSRSLPSLAGGAICDRTAMQGGVWAICPGGMMVTYLHSPSEQGPFTRVWVYPGTGGGGFAPVTGKVAYRYTGVASTDPAIPANELQRTTNGGTTFSPVRRMPFTGFSASELLFFNAEDGLALGAVLPASGNVNQEVFTLFETHDGGRSWSKVSL